MAEHTPGPWNAEPREIGGFVIECKGAVVAIAPRRPRTEAEAFANARLIAAAPDMLEALNGLIAEIDGPDADTVGSSAAVRTARAAIARAES